MKLITFNNVIIELSYLQLHAITFKSVITLQFVTITVLITPQKVGEILCLFAIILRRK